MRWDERMRFVGLWRRKGVWVCSGIDCIVTAWYSIDCAAVYYNTADPDTAI